MRDNHLQPFASNQLPGYDYKLGYIPKWTGVLWQRDGLLRQLAQSLAVAREELPDGAAGATDDRPLGARYKED